MARLEKRLADARRALDSLDELVNRDHLTIPERDGAILRLVSTFEAIWKAAALLLEAREGLGVRSPKEVIRGSRQTKLLEDDDAEEAIRIADRNLTVHMYKREIGESLAERLAGHTAVLRRWLDALLVRAAPSDVYQLFVQAMIERKHIVCMYDESKRELCPIILGHSKGEEKALTFQFGGDSKIGLPAGGDWRCLFLANVTDAWPEDGRWRTGDRHTQPQGCVEIVDLDINPKSPYNPQRRLQQIAKAGPSKRRQTP